MISRKHRTIFVHIPKCAGHSVEMAFLADNGLTWETRAPLLLRPNDDPRAGPPRLAHLTASEYVTCGFMTAEEFDQFYTFAIVRNPWARVVSLYRHLEPPVSFLDFADKWLPNQLREGAKQRWFVRPQTEFLTRDGQIAVDDVFHLERLAHEFPAAAERAGLVTPLPHANRSGDRTAPDINRRPSAAKRFMQAMRSAVEPKHFETRDHWRDYYGPNETAAIARLYAQDCETFGYVYEKDDPVA